MNFHVNKNTKRRMGDFKKLDQNSMDGDTKRLFHRKLNPCKKIGSVEEICSFKNTLKSAVAECAQKSTKKFEKKWVTEEIKSLSKKKVAFTFKFYLFSKKDYQFQMN